MFAVSITSLSISLPPFRPANWPPLCQRHLADDPLRHPQSNVVTVNRHLADRLTREPGMILQSPWCQANIVEPIRHAMKNVKDVWEVIYNRLLTYCTFYYKLINTLEVWPGIKVVLNTSEPSIFQLFIVLWPLSFPLLLLSLLSSRINKLILYYLNLKMIKSLQGHMAAGVGYPSIRNISGFCFCFQ